MGIKPAPSNHVMLNNPKPHPSLNSIQPPIRFSSGLTFDVVSFLQSHHFVFLTFCPLPLFHIMLFDHPVIPFLL